MQTTSSRTSSTVTFTNSKTCLYIHIPFCPTGCKFCHFYLSGGKTPNYVWYLEKEFVQRFWEEKVFVDTIHIGWWTPNLLSDQELESLFACIQKRCYWWKELSIELHTDLLSFSQLDTLKKWWVTRISFGIQSFDKEILAHHARISRNYDKLWWYIEYAKKIGFEKINFDLIYDLIGDSPENIKKNIEFVSRYQPTSVNYYWLRLLTDFLRQNHTINYKRRFAYYLLIRAWLTELWYIQKNEAIYHKPWFENGKNFLYEDYVYSKPHTVHAIGVSASSQSNEKFAKNVISIERYMQLLDGNHSPHDLEFTLDEIPYLLYRFYYWLLMYPKMVFQNFEDQYWRGSIEKIYDDIVRLEKEELITLDKFSVKLTQKWLFYFMALEDILMKDYTRELSLLRKL